MNLKREEGQSLLDNQRLAYSVKTGSPSVEKLIIVVSIGFENAGLGIECRWEHISSFAG